MLTVVVRGVDETFVVVFFTGLLLHMFLFAGISPRPLGSREAPSRALRLGQHRIWVEYFLRVRTNLRTRARGNQVLNFCPVFAVLIDR